MFRLSRRTVALAAACLLSVAADGCSRRQPPTVLGPTPLPETAPAEHVGPPLTDAECQDFADKLAAAARGRDAPAFDALIEWGIVFDRATAGVPVAPTLRQRFVRTARDSTKEAEGFSSQAVKEVAEDGSYRLLRVAVRDGRPRVLFRLLNARSGLNYHEWELVRCPDGQVRAADVFVYLTAENLSRTFRRMFLPMAAQGASDLASRLQGWESEFLANTPALREMNLANLAGRYQEALDAYGRLPAGLRADKAVLILRLQAAQRLSDEAYAAALEDFRAHHADDPCAALVSVDYFVLKKQFAKGVEMADLVEKAVGGDPYLHALRSGLHRQAGDLAAARKAAEQAVREEPTLQEGYWGLVEVTLAEKKYDETARLLTTLEAKFAVTFGDLKDQPEYAEFVKSSPYQQWLKRKKDN